jgi:hypothetical protein
MLDRGLFSLANKSVAQRIGTGHIVRTLSWPFNQFYPLSLILYPFPLSLSYQPSIGCPLWLGGRQFVTL